MRNRDSCPNKFASIAYLVGLNVERIGDRMRSDAQNNRHDCSLVVKISHVKNALFFPHFYLYVKIDV